LRFDLALEENRGSNVRALQTFPKRLGIASIMAATWASTDPSSGFKAAEGTEYFAAAGTARILGMAVCESSNVCH